MATVITARYTTRLNSVNFLMFENFLLGSLSQFLTLNIKHYGSAECWGEIAVLRKDLAIVLVKLLYLR